MIVDFLDQVLIGFLFVSFFSFSTFLIKLSSTNGPNSEIKVGNCLPLSEIPVGIDIHNVEINPGGGGKIARSAGTSVSISGNDGSYSIIKMTSGEVRKIDSRAMATIGVLSNPDQKNIKIGKAGRSRWLGRRPHTRGCLLYTSPSPRDPKTARMPSSA